MKFLTRSLILSIISLASMQALAAVQGNPYDATVEFKTMVKEEKTAWMKFGGRVAQQKHELLAKQVGEWFDLMIEKTKAWKDFSATDSASKNNMESKYLEKSIALHDKHSLEMKAFWDKTHEEAQSMARNNKTKFDAFKQKNGFMPAMMPGKEENKMIERPTQERVMATTKARSPRAPMTSSAETSAPSMAPTASMTPAAMPAEKMEAQPEMPVLKPAPTPMPLTNPAETQQSPEVTPAAKTTSGAKSVFE